MSYSSKEPQSLSSTSTMWLLGLIATIIFIIDVMVPLGIAGGIPYILVVWLSFRHQQSQLPIWTAIGCSILTTLGVFFSPAGGDLWQVMTNRALTLFAIWITALMGRDQVVTARDWTERKYVDQALRESEQQLRNLMDSLPCFVGIWSSDGRFTDCNEFSLRTSGLQREDVLGKHIADTFWINHSLESQTHLHDLFRRVAEGEAIRDDIKVRTRDHTYLTIDACYVPIKNEQGIVTQIVGSGINVTERREAEAALQHSEDQFRDLYESAPLAYFSATFDGHITRVNGRANELLGYSKEELIGKHVLTLYAPSKDGVEKARRLQEKTQEGIAIHDEELEMARKDGTRLWISLTVRLIFDASGEVIERRGMVQDISARKKVESKFRASEYQFRSLVETAGSAIIGITSEGWIVEWNREAERLYGKTREEVLDQNYLELFIPESHQSILRAEITQVLAGKPTRDLRAPIINALGKERQISWNIDRLLDEKSEPYGVICVGRDITDWEQAQAQLQKWATIFQHTQWGVAVSKGNSSNFEMVNEAYARMHGYAIRELDGAPIAQIFTPKFRVQLPQIMARIHEEGMFSFEATHVRKDGSTFPTLVTVSAIKDLMGQTLYRVGNVIDITTIKETEQALQESQRIYQDLIQTIDGIVWECEFPSFQVTFVSPYAQTLLEYSLEEWKDEPKFLINMIHPDDRQRIADYCHQKAMAKENHTMEYRVRHANGSSVWLRDQVTVVVKDAQPVKLRGIMVDITKLKELEDTIREQNQALEKQVERRTRRIQDLEQRRMQIEKLAALSQVTAGVAHEINNPLASISQCLILLKKAVPAEHPHFRYLSKMEDCIDRMSQITTHLYQLYQPSSSPQTTIDLRAPIKTAVDIMQSHAEKRAIALTLEDLTMPIMATIPRNELIQVLCNLIQNALDASQANDTIGVTAEVKSDTVMVYIIDHGSGISPEITSRIFEPFFSTKQGLPGNDLGLGLGLAISNSLIEAMGGTLNFSTSIGLGTAFTITLPLHLNTHGASDANSRDYSASR